jgi:hypothetical protein
MYKAILTAAALALSAPLTPALAHDDDDNRYSGYSAHSRFHDSHEEGFSSWRGHRAFIVRLGICTGSTTRIAPPTRTIAGIGNVNAGSA